MRTVGVKELKNRLSEYVRLVKRGETVAVTDRGQVVLEMVPTRTSTRPKTPEEQWADLIRRGIVTPAKNPKGPLPERTPLVPFETLMKELDADREDR